MLIVTAATVIADRSVLAVPGTPIRVQKRLRYSPPDEEIRMPTVSPEVAFCLQRVGRDRVGWDTLVVSGTADTTVPAEVVWATWTDLERWPVWSPLHRSATRASTAELGAGSTFDQQLSLGFPIGTTSQHIIIDLLEPARRVSWSGDSNGIKSCHLWSFTPSPNRGTHVSNVEVFAGVTIALIRPLVARRWNRQFQAAVDGLIRSAAGRIRPDDPPVGARRSRSRHAQ